MNPRAGHIVDGRSMPEKPGAAASTLKMDDLIDRNSAEGLVRQIFDGIRSRINAGAFGPGSKLPSVRSLANTIGASTFTVASAYDMLVSRYIVENKPGSGYFVPVKKAPAVLTVKLHEMPKSISDFWLSLEVFSYGRQVVSPACGWLPPDWYNESPFLGDSLRRVARLEPAKLVGYGNPAGYGRLRQHLAQALTNQQLSVTSDQIVLTHGATHAMDLVARTFLKPGDTVLVEDPGYSNLHGLLNSLGCILLPVSRTGSGIDLDAVALQAEVHRPRMMFVTTVMHNPLGTTLRQFEAHRLLALAENYDFLIVEDDIFRSFAPASAPCLAAMGGLNRVLSINGLSKAIAPSLRIGYVACDQDFAEQILQTKMLSGLTSSEVIERVAFHCLSDPRQRRTINRLSERLTDCHATYRLALQRAGLQMIAEPDGGMFVSAGWPVAPTQTCDARTVAKLALEQGIVLAPGCFFDLTPSRSIWFRFNVSHSEIDTLVSFLQMVPKHYGW